MTEDPPGLAVLYAAKSTTDNKGSIRTQYADTRAAAAAEGQEVVAEYHDEAKSAFSRNRGPGLVAALDHAERIRGHLWVQHSDRLARGDGDRAQHLVELVLRSRRSRFRFRSVQDPQTFDTSGLTYAALMGDQNYAASERKSDATRAGLRRRKDRGEPMGPLPYGYTVEFDKTGMSSRVIDPETVGVVERIFALVESGASPGDVARALNAEGVVTQRGKTWVGRTVARMVRNADYKGEGGYPAIIDSERFDAIVARLPVLESNRRGGRTPVDQSFFLRGIARCRECGASLYTREQSVGRVYICANRRQGTGLCSAPVIPADLIESHVLRYLWAFVGRVEDWISSQLAERETRRAGHRAALERARAALAALNEQRERHLTEYRCQVDEGAATARLALEEVQRIDAKRLAQKHEIAEAEAVMAEWSGAPDVDAALDYYNRIVGQLQGRVREAADVAELNLALRTVVEGLWAEIEGGHLYVEFMLLDEREFETDGQAVRHSAGVLPPRDLHDRSELDYEEPESLLGQTRTQTKVNRCLAEGRAALRRLEASPKAA